MYPPVEILQIGSAVANENLLCDPRYGTPGAHPGEGAHSMSQAEGGNRLTVGPPRG